MHLKISTNISHFTAMFTNCGIVMTYSDIDLGQHCLTAPSHYMTQFWLIISGVVWHSPEGNSTENAGNICLWYELENDWFLKIPNELSLKPTYRVLAACCWVRSHICRWRLQRHQHMVLPSEQTPGSCRSPCWEHSLWSPWNWWRKGCNILFCNISALTNNGIFL